jgi:glycerol-3-phosphate O-acyltransferase
MMGAYFIRRQARGALYRKVLARYVQMATAGGVSQGIFPEGGLSLTGHLMPPKMGLLSYLAEGQAGAERDLVFVPVAINYDRVLEDRVLIAAGQRGDRRFGARISVVVRFILRKFWQAVRGRYVRFGTAAVAFGQPLSLQDFGADRPVAALATELMDRIDDAMPVLVVPLLAHHLQQAQAPLAREVLLQELQGDITRFGAHMPAMTSEALEQALDKGLESMRRNATIEENAKGWKIAAGEEAVVAFYASSIAHRFERNRAVAE